MQRHSITPWLIIGDWLVLLLFVLIGQRDHGITGVAALPSLLITTLALAVPWTVTVMLLGVAGFGEMSWQPWLGRVVAAWLIAAPLGLLIRALLRGQATIIVPFMLVVLGLGGLFVLGWRAAAFWWVGRRARSRRVEARRVEEPAAKDQAR